MILETKRLRLRELTLNDAEFIYKLVNDPSWLEHIGDKQVRNLNDAKNYITSGPQAMYQKHGFGLYLTELKENNTPIGLCGLIKRDTLNDVDIGYAFMPEFWGQGYAYEAISTTLEYGKDKFKLNRIVAIVSPQNHPSIKLLEKIGMIQEDRIKLSPEANEVILLSIKY